VTDRIATTANGHMILRILEIPFYLVEPFRYRLILIVIRVTWGRSASTADNFGQFWPTL